MKSFRNKVAAITGAASGIGQALAIALAKEGCHLALSDVDTVGLKKTVAELKQYDVSVCHDVLDVSDHSAVKNWADKVVDYHGKVNLIFNNAGVAMGGTVEDTPLEDYEWILNINLWGVIYGTKAFLPYIKSSGEEGHVVNISSVFGLFSQPTQSAYNTSKFAVRGFTESLRQELDMEKGSVSASCVHPGGIKTNIVKNARMNKSVESIGKQASAEEMRDQFESLFITTSEKAASVILKGVKSNQRRILIGPDAKLLDVMARALPASYQTLVEKSLAFTAR
ncbi:SDR family NAD(P)-dependent oxidoreductase [Marinobacter litoralis]|uniref:SDR family NAD(P)-dependent oxidoreductase n=1 Tax=Marinobacter litoralis TaxID=187981 RepID=UPI0018EDDE30|nr:SDR family NAD(P)-dependent oxidoreductase [Marinobacter litoralis]MBJ6138461.1 SDR family NAD(P)-dependent oxidoreductase [Marinobacter litoralis]